MFLGQFVCVVDEDGRLALPAGFADALTVSAYITQGFERDLMVVPADAFSAIYSQVAALSKTDPMSRLLTRLLMGSASILSIDADGRATIPSALRQFSGIKEQAVLVGSGNLFEIWSPDNWETQRSRMQDAQENAHRFANLSLVAAN